jgi:hypothetical protein
MSGAPPRGVLGYVQEPKTESVSNVVLPAKFIVLPYSYRYLGIPPSSHIPL